MPASITLTVDRVDAFVNKLGDGGHEGRVKQALLTYRRNPSGGNKTAAETAINGLGKEHQRQFRAVAKHP
jgi:hypothetical protein